MAARDPKAALNVNHRLITRGVLETMGTPIVRGRDFSSADRIDTQPVVRQRSARAPAVAMDAYWTGSIARERVSAAFMIGFGAFGLLLAAFGIYGVMALTVAQRRVESGIRMALGARPSDMLRLILRRSLALVGAGIGIGVVVAAALGRVIAGLLTSAGGIDPSTLAAACVLIFATASVACVLPAMAAQRVDPVRALND